MPKINIEIEKPQWWDLQKPMRDRPMLIKEALPFFRSGFGKYTHRVRSGAFHRYNGQITHAHFHFWCGGTGFLDKKPKCGEFFESLEDGKHILCATCEGRAIGAGLIDARKINGRTVCYRPREKASQT